MDEVDFGEYNPLFKRILRACVQKRRASVAVLQKEFDMGYETAVEILDIFTEKGLIGKADGMRPRPLLNLAFETVALWNAQDELEEERKRTDNDERDELFEDALRVCVEMRRASTSVIQRRLRIGYGRAAAILDSMERSGFIGQADGAMPRPVLGRAYETVAQWDQAEKRNEKRDVRAEPPRYNHSGMSAYDLLGVQPGDTVDEITAAYHRTAKMYHPDKVASLAPEFRELAERKMKEINAAYEQLKKPL